MKRNILILSGGGCKGYAQVQVLKKLEEDYGTLCYYYDLIAGSSVGAINGAMAASGRIMMANLEFIYDSMIRKVFKKSWFPLKTPMYDRKNFIEIWNEKIGMMKMGDCKTKLQITSVNLCDRRNHFFKSWEDCDGVEYLVSQVCKSFAAPLYFGSLIDDLNKSVWFDGGTSNANLPLTYGLVEAFLLWPNDEWHFDIIGCGYADQSLSFKDASKYNWFKQLFQFFDLKDGGLAREMARQEQIGAIQIIAESSTKISFNYYDIVIPENMDKLDGIKYLSEYKKFGEEMAKTPLIVG
jgi:predicted acylesterase/phospholipase RssA